MAPLTSPPRIVIRCAKWYEYTIGLSERVINVSTNPDHGGCLDMPVNPKDLAPHTNWLSPLWENINEVECWARNSGSIIVLCDTGMGVSRLVAAILEKILTSFGAIVTKTPPPEPNTGWISEMYTMCQQYTNIGDFEDRVFWFLNGEPVGFGAHILGADY